MRAPLRISTRPPFPLSSREVMPMTAGRKLTPADAKSTERLMRYWSEGEGAAKIGWG